jgi:hypothetical protein
MQRQRPDGILQIDPVGAPDQVPRPVESVPEVVGNNKALAPTPGRVVEAGLGGLGGLFQKHWAPVGMPHRSHRAVIGQDDNAPPEREAAWLEVMIGS